MKTPRSVESSEPETQSFDEICSIEKAKLGIEKDSEARGLALSGGGIRSASFGLGVIQALLEHGILQKIDYLSTVSGGGYIGAALTWNRHLHADTGAHSGHRRFFDDTDPFGQKGKGVRSHSTTKNYLSYLRQHGNYLNPNRLLDFTSAVSVALRNLLISLFIYTSLAITVLSLWMIAEHYAAQNLPGFDNLDKAAIELKTRLESDASKKASGSGSEPVETPPPEGKYDWLRHSFFQVNVLIAGFFMALLIFYGLCFSLSTFLVPFLENVTGFSSYLNRNVFQIISGIFLKIVIVFLFLAALPVVEVKFADWTQPLGIIGSISGIWAALSKFRTFLGKESLFKKTPWLGDRLFELGALLFLFGMLAFSYHMGLKIGIPSTAGETPGATMWPALSWIAGVALYFALVVNINYASLGRMYRDRLMETFLPDDTAVKNNRWQRATDAHDALLEKMCGNDDGPIRKPLHLINTNVILTNSRKEKYRRRGGDSFLLSPLYCGSDSSGYIPTTAFMKSKFIGGGGMRLATAMAISGAAANPHTGIAGKGPTRGPLVSILMTIFNLRLGAWILNPKKHFPMPMMNYIVPGLCSLLPFGHKESSFYLELTDGGHFENLGLYELVRRRVGTIIVSDAGVDKDFKFGDLANAIEKVRTDFGVSIRFSPEDKILNKVLPGSASNENSTQDVNTLDDLADQGYIVGRIKYPKTEKQNEFTGRIFLLKTTMTRNLPADLYSYRANNTDFPDQPTADQFFDEKQFEAYRELGYRSADDLCSNFKNIL